MNDKKKKYVVPEAEVINFINDDIITGSGDSNWGNDDNVDSIDWGN